jgi:glyoxylase-like metal-dependent hydrolase (beta-lactamase superfamily II)
VVNSDRYICTTCGTQYEAADRPPAECGICRDERQYVPESGQSWTTLGALRRTRRNAWHRYEPALWGIGTEPAFAIGQRALLIRHRDGNVLWDCITLIDDATVDLVNALGGLRAIAISHPHYYSAMVEWSQAFGDVPVYLHENDREWVMRQSPHLRFWGGDRTSIGSGLTLVRCGGHFAGGSVLHWAEGANGNGALLTGDIVQVSPDRTSVSFMYSYPNFIPLSARAVADIATSIDDLRYERIYGAWWDRWIGGNGKAAVARSVERYRARLSS